MSVRNPISRVSRRGRVTIAVLAVVFLLFTLFDRVIGMLTDSRSWQQAEQALRRMIARQRAAGQGENADVMIPLWRKLGDVYRTGIRDLASAAEAYGECARLAPKDRYAKMVAEMTARSPVLAALQAR